MTETTNERLGLQPQDFQKTLAQLITEVRAFAVAEDPESVSLVLSDLLPRARGLLQHSLQVLADLEAVATAAATGNAAVRSNWARRTGTLILPRAFEELSDMCFLATVECRACLRQLNELSAESEVFALLVSMERAQARVSNGLCAVEERLARMSGRDSTTRHVDLGRASLRARRLIARFRRRIGFTTAPAAADLEKRLRSVGTSLAWLLGHDHFRSLRASDRLTARELHRRILVWLRDDRSEETSQHLWQETVAFVELTRLINQRPEIVQHDLEAVYQVIGILADSEAHAPLPCSIVEPLNTLLGRDELLDEMLVRDAETSQVLARLLEIYALLEREGAALGSLPRGPDDRPGGRRGQAGKSASGTWRGAGKSSLDKVLGPGKRAAI